MVCSDIHQPEPDFMVLRGRLEEYADLPTAADAYGVVEVADSSYERDTGEKLVGYAQAGIQQYVVLNLRARVAEIYASPNLAQGTYPAPQIVLLDSELMLRIGDNETLAVPLVNLLP